MEKKSGKSWTISDVFWEAIDENDLPPAVVLSGANTHDVKLLEDTLDHIVVLRPEADKEHPQNLCLDAGYTGGDGKVQSRGYMPHIRPCGEEKKELERNPDFRAHRWVVEVTHSFLTVFVNCRSVMKRKPPIIWLLFSLLALLLSVANSCALIADQGIHFTSPVQSFPLLSFSYLRIGSNNIMLKICRSM